MILTRVAVAFGLSLCLLLDVRADAPALPTMGELQARKAALDMQVALVEAQVVIARYQIRDQTATLDRDARLVLHAAPDAVITWAKQADGSLLPTVAPEGGTR